MDTPQINYAHLLTLQWDKTQIDQWLQEDIPSFDYGGLVVGKSTGVLAGSPFFTEIFKHIGCEVEWKVKEGTLITVEPGQRIEVAIVRGEARKLLVGERTALNTLARASGIASVARKVREIGDKANFKVTQLVSYLEGQIAGTRKTTPGFRVVEKYALLVGGCDQHRFDLSSMIMLKDNHIWSSGSITNAVKKARQVGGFALKIEVECQSETEAKEAIAAGADVVMLDNFAPQKLQAAAASLKADHPHVIIEASGGITPDTLADYLSDAVDVISMGSLTQGVPHVDFSLKVRH